MAMPLPMIVILLLISIFVKKKKLKSWLRYAAVLLLLFFSNPYFSNRAISSWEGRPTPLENLQHHDLAIVLTGVTNRYKRPLDRVYFERGADRVLHTIKLFKMGLIDQILISGGSGKLINNEDDIKEADELAKIMKLAGVPDSIVFIENMSRNTYESSVNSAELILENLQAKRILLVTSAFHIPRATACFKKQGLTTTPFGTDYYSHDRYFGVEAYIIPNPSAIAKWNIIFKEVFGIIMYKLLGYC